MIQYLLIPVRQRKRHRPPPTEITNKKNREVLQKTRLALRTLKNSKT
jgi:hypothetical protein